MSFFNEENNSTDPCFEADEEMPIETGLHIFSIFAILLTSAAGVFLPIIFKRCGKKVSSQNPLFLVGKFFGGGVLVSTAFIHVLPQGVEALTDPCLPEFFTETYPTLAYLLAMVSALGLHFIEYLVNRYTANSNNGTDDEKMNERSPIYSGGQSDHEHHHNHDQEHGHHHHHHHFVSFHSGLTSIILLEAAVAIHSIIIGIALGLSTTEFATLWIALSFHQFFEGLGIGSRIADAKEYSTLAAFVNGGMFAITTPIGIALGIGISEISTFTGTTGVITQGTLECIAAGLLLYSALVTVTAEEFSANNFSNMQMIHRVIAFTTFYIGVIAMAVIGIWA